MATVNLQVSAGNQDAHEAETNYGFTSSDNGCLIQAAANNYERFWIGLYFGNVTIPQGATITSATLQVYPLSGTQNLVGTIVGNDVDNAANFATSADVNGRTQTTASVNWTATPLTSSQFNNSPDIASVIQEIVDRPGWSSGNAMVILVKGRSQGSTQSGFIYAYDLSSANAAKLSITYATGTTTNDERDAEVSGSAIANSERDVEVTGVATAQAERDAEVSGQVMTSSERGAEVSGVDTDTSDRGAEVTGSISVQSERDAEVSGVATITSERDAEVSGSQNVISERDAEVTGVSTSTSERDAEITGSQSATDERAAEVDGTGTVVSNRSAEVHGVNTASSERDAEVNGASSSVSERGAEITGIATTQNERSSEVTGSVGPVITDVSQIDANVQITWTYNP